MMSAIFVKFSTPLPLSRLRPMTSPFPLSHGHIACLFRVKLGTIFLGYGSTDVYDCIDLCQMGPLSYGSDFQTGYQAESCRYKAGDKPDLTKS